MAGNIYFHGQMRAGIEAALVFRGKRRPAWAMTRLHQVPGLVVTIFREVPFNIEGFAYLQKLFCLEYYYVIFPLGITYDGGSGN